MERDAGSYLLENGRCGQYATNCMVDAFAHAFVAAEVTGLILVVYRWLTPACDYLVADAQDWRFCVERGGQALGTVHPLDLAKSRRGYSVAATPLEAGLVAD